MMIFRSLVTAVFYFVVACVVEEVANHIVKKVKKKYQSTLETKE
jgi:hypothetical protein